MPALADIGKSESSMLKEPKKKCFFVKNDGSGCDGYPIAGSIYCFAHQPGKERERHAARSAGGSRNKATTLPRDTVSLSLRTTDDLMALMELTINDVRRGTIDPKIANSIGYLTTIQLKVIAESVNDRRLAMLEATLPNRSSASLVNFDKEL
jgi:hypothetical protein